MDRFKKPVVGKYELEPPKSLGDLPNSGADLGGEGNSGVKPIYQYARSLDYMEITPGSLRGPGPHADRAGPTPPDAAAGFYCFGARRYAEPDLRSWRPVGPGLAVAWMLILFFVALLGLNLVAMAVS